VPHEHLVRVVVAYRRISVALAASDRAVIQRIWRGVSVLLQLPSTPWSPRWANPYKRLLAKTNASLETPTPWFVGFTVEYA